MTNNKKLMESRLKMDEIDKKIAKLLRIRMKILSEIKKIKQEHKISIKDPKREKNILGRLETNYEKNIFKKILQESRKLQAERRRGLRKTANI